MTRAPGILNRFRRLLAPPGRPAQALGVPAAGEELEAELGPLLRELDAVGAEAVRIEEQAAVEAERRRERAVHEAAAIVEDARGRADAERARAASVRRDAVHAEVERARADAAREAERIRHGLADRVAGPVEEVVACVRATGR